MTGVTAHWIPLPGREDAVQELLREMQRLTREEPGCLMYELHRTGDGFMLYERYVDDDAVERHHATEHYQTLVAGRAPGLLKRRDIVRGVLI